MHVWQTVSLGCSETDWLRFLLIKARFLLKMPRASFSLGTALILKSMLEAMRATESMVPVLQCPILKRETTADQGKLLWQMLLVAKDVILTKNFLQLSFCWHFLPLLAYQQKRISKSSLDSV